jgi:hypothetical protein
MRMIMAVLVLFATGTFANAGTLRLRFVDTDSLEPISSASLSLLPRRILLDMDPGADIEDPNLQFAQGIQTDSAGYVSLQTDMLDELTSQGKIVVDSRSDDYARFVLKKDGGYYITTFSPLPDGRVYSSSPLLPGRTSVVLLEREAKEHKYWLRKKPQQSSGAVSAARSSTD